MAAPEKVPGPIDVDDLAREKVQDIESSLDASDNHRLDSFDPWFAILRQIITAADLHRTNDSNDNPDSAKSKIEAESIYAYYTDDNEQFHAVDPLEQFASYSVKWTIRVKAFKLVHRLVHNLSQPSRNVNSRNLLLKYLPDLVRLSFVAATSPYDDLKLQGFEMFRNLVNLFASVEEKQFQGHSIIEQYKVQIMSALRPAFSLDSPPYITAIASRICSLWICSGLEKDVLELRRIYESMMMTTIEKLENQSVNQNSKLYTESELEQERLDILGSWAQLYSLSCCDDFNFYKTESRVASYTGKVDPKLLRNLIQPQVTSLVDKWWEALKDYALLILPAPKIAGVGHDNEHVYTKDVALKLFDSVWSKILLAVTIWLITDQPKHCDEGDHQQNNTTLEECCDREEISDKRLADKKKYFNFICGLVMKEFSRCATEDIEGKLSETTLLAANSLMMLVTSDVTKLFIIEDFSIANEFYRMIYNILLKQTKFRNLQYSYLKNLMDLIFDLVAMKISSKPGAILFGIASQVDSLVEDVAVINRDIPDSLAYHTFQHRIHIKTGNILISLKNANTSENIVDEHLLDGVIQTMQLVMKLDPRSSFGLTMFETAKNLYDHIPEGHLAIAIDKVFDTKIEVISSLLYSMKFSTETDQVTIQDRSFLDTVIKFIRHDIKRTKLDHRNRLIDCTTSTLLKVCPPIQTDSADHKLTVESDHVSIILKHLKELEAEYEDKFKGALSDSTKSNYEVILKSQQDAREKRDAQINSARACRANQARNSQKQPAKIVLKADFSNFYNKKSSS